MTLFFSMLPFYLLGNFHCLGMCGPLVMTIGQHRYRYFYFLGRAVSFSTAGMFAGGIGAVFQAMLQPYHLSALVSLSFGIIMMLIGISMVTGYSMLGGRIFSKYFARWNEPIAKLILQDKKWTTFLFGFFTVLLPCGQTVIVFSACALTGSLLTGLINGCAFALLTSPALLISMHTHRLFRGWNQSSIGLIGCFGIVAGLLAWCRGLADMQLIPHLMIPQTHIVFF